MSPQMDPLMAAGWNMRQAEVDRLKDEIATLQLQVETHEATNKMQVAYITRLRTVVEAAREAGVCCAGTAHQPCRDGMCLLRLRAVIAIFDKADTADRTDEARHHDRIVALEARDIALCQDLAVLQRTCDMQRELVTATAGIIEEVRRLAAVDHGVAWPDLVHALVVFDKASPQPAMRIAEVPGVEDPT